MKAANNNTILAFPSAGVSPVVATFVEVLLDRTGTAVAFAFETSFFFCAGLLGFGAAGFAGSGAPTFTAAAVTGAAARTGAGTATGSSLSTALFFDGVFSATATGAAAVAAVKLNAHFILSSMIVGTFFHCKFKCSRGVREDCWESIRSREAHAEAEAETNSYFSRTDPAAACEC